MERNYSLHDLLAAIRRRRGLALGVFGAALAAGIALALLLPNVYVATSVVQIEPHRLGFEFSPAQNATPFEDRMRTVKHGVLARPILERVIRETDFFPKLRDRMDEAVEQMRRHVEVRLEGEVPAGAPALLFVVEVRGGDPKKVAKAAELLPRYYAQLTSDVLRDQARALENTLDGQAKEMARTLANDDANLVAFKVQHASDLPEVVEDHARSMSRLQTVLEMHLGTMADAAKRRSILLGTVPEVASAPGLAEAALDAATRRLATAKAAYGEDHPEVRRAERELNAAKARRDEELRGFRDERLGGEVKRIDEQIELERSEVASIERQMSQLQAHIDAAPKLGQELSNASREGELLRAKYSAVLSRRADAELAAKLLDADGSTLFRAVDVPPVPSRPSEPDRQKLLVLAFFAAIAASLGAAGIAEWLDPSMRGPEDGANLGVPILAAIPRISPRRAS